MTTTTTNGNDVDADVAVAVAAAAETKDASAAATAVASSSSSSSSDNLNMDAAHVVAAETMSPRNTLSNANAKRPNTVSVSSFDSPTFPSLLSSNAGAGRDAMSTDSTSIPNGSTRVLTDPATGAPLTTKLAPTGVRLSHLKSLVVPLTYTTRDVVRHVFRDFTKANPTLSYAQTLALSRPELTSDAPTTFISHTHKEMWCDLMSALDTPHNDNDDDRNDDNNNDRVVWLDAACVSPHVPLETPCSDFRDIINLPSIRTVELVVAPLRNPISVRRTWVHFEIITATRAGKNVKVRAPAHEVTALRKSLSAPGASTAATLETLNFFTAIPHQAVDKFNCSRDTEFAAMIKTVRPNVHILVSLLSKFYVDEVLTPPPTSASAPALSSPEKLKLLQARGIVMWLTNRLDDACKSLTKAVTYVTTNPDKGDVPEALTLLADVLRDVGDYEQALDFYERSKKLHAAATMSLGLASPTPSSSLLVGAGMGAGPNKQATLKAKIAAADDVYKSGLCLAALGRFREAKTAFEDCLATRKELLGDAHASVADALYALGQLCYERGLFHEAIPLYEETVAIRRGDAVVNPKAYADAHFALGCAYRSTDVARALENLNQAHSVRRRVLGEDHPLTIAALSTYGLTLLGAKRLDKARPILYAVVDALKRTLGPSHPDTATAIVNLALLLHQTNNLEESCRLYEQAIDVRKKNAPDSMDVAKAMFGLALVLRDRNLPGQSHGVAMLAHAMAKKHAAAAASTNDRLVADIGAFLVSS